MMAGTQAEHQSDGESTKDNLHLALMDELWGIFCEYFWESWPRYNGTALYNSFPFNFQWHLRKYCIARVL